MMITAIVVFFLRIAFIAGEPTGKASFFLQRHADKADGSVHLKVAH